MAKTTKKKPVVEEAVESAKAVLGKIEDAVESVGEAVKEAIGEEKNDSKKTKKDDVEDKKKKLASLLEKAKALEGKVKESESSAIKEKVTGGKEEKKETLVPIEDYLKSSIHLGTRVITPDMRSYVYRRRADGLAVFNTALLDDKMREGAEYLAKFSPEDMIVICKREAGWKAVSLFAKTLGIKAFTKKYPAGVLTNTNLETFFETKLVFICDPWLDKNALSDANRVGVPVLSICDTNNFTTGINQIIPSNNKSWKSLGMVFYLLTKLYIEKNKLDIAVPPIQEFVEGWDDLQPPA